MTRPTSASHPGSQALSPWSMPLAAWKQVVLRAWKEGGDDNIGLISAGVAFYGFLAMVPLLGATVLVYGLAADPQTVVDDMRRLTTMLPADVARLVGEQLMSVVRTSEGKKGLGLAVALGIALFGARNGAGAIVTALNIAYEEKETRGFVMLNLLAIGLTIGAVLVAIVAVVAVAALGHLDSLFPGAPALLLGIGKLLTYALLLLAGAAGAATLYRYGPDRARAKWVWISPGSLLAALLWLAITFGFGLYVANFGNYDATYGSLGAVVVLLTWLFLSSYVLVFGAELNSELEHQTARDSTTGIERPMGTRGAEMADRVIGDDVAVPAPALPARSVLPPPRASATSLPAPAIYLLAKAPRLLGGPSVGAVTTLLATGGLSLLKRRGKGAAGGGLLAGAGLLAWLGRDKDAVRQAKR